MNREIVAEQCPAQLSALTASTHFLLYKKDANSAGALSVRLLRGADFIGLQLLIHLGACRTK
jgi:hypothetical protein